VCYKIKSGDPATLSQVGLRLQEHLSQNDALTPLFGDDVTLVPMPRSAPLVAGALWPAQKICEAIVHRGLAVRAIPALERVEAVQKSSRAAPGERPAVSRHYDSLRAHSRVDVSDRILVVDDVVTKGATAIAAVSRLAESYPNAEVVLFAAIRTKGLVPEIDRILDPVMGIIRLNGDEVLREP
jgi:predicted phosphoribosyltransferase